MSYPTPEAHMSIKTSEFTPAVNLDYNSAGMMFDSVGIDASTAGATGVPNMTMSGSTNTGVSPSQQVSAGNTPQMLRTQLETPPLSLGNVVNNSDMSPVGTLTAPATLAPNGMDNAPGISTILRPEAPRTSGVSESDANTGINSIVAGMSIDTRSSFLHMQAYGVSPGATGTGSAGNANSVFSSAERNADRSEICEDPSLNNVAYWDDKNNVCIPVMETLRKALNSMGMTAHHTDSLQKNFNDYQFKRMTDQRRTRHTNQHGVVKFHNPNFVPNHAELLQNIVRKSALKKQQSLSARDRTSSATLSRKRNRSSSMRQVNGRVIRQPMPERMNPYMRYGPADQNGMQALPISISPSNSFQAHHGPQVNTMSQIYTPGDQSGMIMPLDVQNFGFGIQQPMGMNEPVNQSLLHNNGSQYQQSPFYVDQSPSNLVMHNFIPQSQVPMSSSLAHSNEPSAAHSQGYQHSEFSLQQQYQQPHSSEYGHGHQQNYSPMPLQQHGYPEMHQNGGYYSHQQQQHLPTPGYGGVGPESDAPDSMNNGGYNV
ncbi:hypothetical protein LPJ72_002395 [Coemansia sp. Benny D160-2]|nr:hypothetical protein LPJ72_002395 [Coemansia sp. Benny D160-2]